MVLSTEVRVSLLMVTMMTEALMDALPLERKRDSSSHWHSYSVHAWRRRDRPRVDWKVSRWRNATRRTYAREGGRAEATMNYRYWTSSMNRRTKSSRSPDCKRWNPCKDWLLDNDDWETSFREDVNVANVLCECIICLLVSKCERGGWPYFLSLSSLSLSWTQWVVNRSDWCRSNRSKKRTNERNDKVDGKILFVSPFLSLWSVCLPVYGCCLKMFPRPKIVETIPQI